MISFDLGEHFSRLVNEPTSTFAPGPATLPRLDISLLSALGKLADLAPKCFSVLQHENNSIPVRY
jgi:hypothetical protein